MSRNQIARLNRVPRIEAQRKALCTTAKDKYTEGHKRSAAYRG
jgi:hypothetical protein